jgi:hypothetical protein
MADITPAFRRHSGTALVVEWDQINADDEGAAVAVTPALPDKTVYMTGTFNGGAYTLQCSPDNVVWQAALSASDASAIEFTAAGHAVVGSNAPFWRVANDNNGTAEDVNVHLVCSE